MTEDVQGLEEHGEESPWCVQCAHWFKWPGHDECLGCLNAPGKPAETVTLRTVHWDTAVLHASIRRKVAVWEQRHPGWELVSDMQRYWEDSTQPSKYVDRETSIGRKLAWTRFRVERKHPRGVRVVRLTGEALWRVMLGQTVVAGPPGTTLAVSARELEDQLQAMHAAFMRAVVGRWLKRTQEQAHE
jgi:hypothetical protein